MKVKTETIQNEEIDIEVTVDGWFAARYDEEDYRAKSMDELIEKLKRQVDKARNRQAHPVTVIGIVPRAKKSTIYREEPYEDGDGFVHAVLRKKHERQGQYLFTAVDGTKFQLSSYRDGRSKVCRRLTAEEAKTYEQLAHAVTESQAALENWLVSVRVDAEELLGGKR